MRSLLSAIEFSKCNTNHSTSRATQASVGPGFEDTCMDTDRVELVRILFVAMTERAEALHESAMGGQALHASVRICRDNAQRVIELAQTVCTLAKAAEVLCEGHDADSDD